MKHFPMKEIRHPQGLTFHPYDNPQPAPGIERVLAVEALSARSRVVFVVVGSFDCRQDRVYVVEQPASPATGEVQVRAGIEYDLSTMRVYGSLLVALHRAPRYGRL